MAIKISFLLKFCWIADMAKNQINCIFKHNFQKLSEKKPIKPQDVPRFKKYPLGIPCRSTVLPSFISQIPAVKQRKSETMISLCYVPCPTLPAVRNITGRLSVLHDLIIKF